MIDSQQTIGIRNEHTLFNISVLTDIIDEYSFEYLLKPFFKECLHKINWGYLSLNQNAIDILMKNTHRIDWNNLSSNPSAIDILRDNKDKINWYYLSANPNAIELLRENPDKINWSSLSSNPNAVELFKENFSKIWNYLSSNPVTVDILRKNKDKFDWRILSIVNCFTEEQKEEFGEFIPKISNLEISEIKTPNLKEIRQMIKAQVKTLTSNSQEKSRFDVKHSSERLTRDDLFRIKQTIQEAESKRGI